MQLFLKVHKQKFCGLMHPFDLMFCNAHCASVVLLCFHVCRRCV